MCSKYIYKVNFIIFFILISNIPSLCYGEQKNKVPKIWNIAYERKKFFGREEILQKINTVLEPSNEETKEVSITGLPGIGKTQIAKQYAKKYLNNYDIVWWFYASDNLENQFLKLGLEFSKKNHHSSLLLSTNNPSESIEEIKEYLRTTPKNWLLIFDNTPNDMEIEKYIPHHHASSRGHIIITSKNSKGWKNSIQVKNFSRNTSVELICEVTGERDIKAASKLAQALTDYPLLVSNVSYSIKNSSLRIIEYLKFIYEKNNKYDSIETANHAMEYSLDKIKEKSNKAYQLALFASLLFHENIPREFMENWFIQSKIGNISDFNDSLSLLEDYLLLTSANTTAEEIQQGYKRYNMHEIVKKIIMNKINKKDFETLSSEAISTITTILKYKGKKVVTHEFSYIFPQILYLSNLVKNIKIKNNLISPLNLEILEYYLLVERNYVKSEDFIKSISPLIDSHKRCETEICAKFNNSISGLMWWKGKHFEGIKHQEKAISYYERNKSLSNEYIRGLFYLASHYNLMGDIEQTLKTLKKAKKLNDKNAFHNNDTIFKNFNTALYYQINASVFSMQNKHSLALTELENALQEVYKITKTFNDPEKALSIYLHFLIAKEEYLFLSGKAEGQQKKLLNLYDKSISVYKTKKHKLSAVLLAMIGRTYNLQNDYIQAEFFLKQSIELFDSWFGHSYVHRDQAWAHVILGDIYMNASNYIKATQEYLIAEKIYKNAYVSLKSDEISVLYEKIILVSLKLKDDLMARKYQNFHMIYFGKDHPKTEIIQSYILE